MANNSEQIEIWNGDIGQRWTEEQALLDAMLAPLGLAGLERADITPGTRVLDIGCGCGDTSLAIAEQVGADGHITGIDISEPMLARAQARAEGRKNLTFQKADATTHRFAPASADLIFSRFGVMFFDDPVAAFSNMRGALTPEGRLCNVVWRPVRENPWVLKSLMVAAEHVQMPQPARPEDPGPFSFGEPERVERILGAAGFDNIALEPVDAKITVGAGLGLSDAVTFLLGIGPLRLILAEQDDATQNRVRDAVTEAVKSDFGADGLQMDAAIWIVTARSK